MKNTFKFIAIAILLVFTAISCSLPDNGETEYDWSAVNNRNDPSQNENHVIAMPQLVNGGVNTSASAPQVTIRFPTQADFFKKSDIEAELKKFLAFYTFTDPTDIDWFDKGLVSVLSPPIDYDLFRRAGNDVTLNLKYRFSDLSIDYSNIVVKISGTSYTYSNGIKMDLDNDTIKGEANVDDLYLIQNVTGAQNWTFVSPGNKFWNIWFALNLGTITFDGTETVSEERESVIIATIDIKNISVATDNGKATYKAVADQFKGGIKLQKQNANGWSDVGTVEYDPEIYVNYLIVKDIKFEHLGIYRIAWKGSADLRTTASYFGVQQRIFITGDIVPNLMRHTYALTEAYRYNLRVVNNRLYQEMAANNFTATLHSHDNDNKNVVLRLEFPLLLSGIASPPYVELNELTLNNFKNSFKIVRNQTGGTFTDWRTVNNLVYVDIKEIRYASENVSIYGNNYKNVIYLTLDPSYRWIDSNPHYFLINDGFTYTGTEPERKYGNITNINDNKFRQYSRTTTVTYPPPPVLNLTLGTPGTVIITQNLRNEVRFTATTAGIYRFESSNNGDLDPIAYTTQTGFTALDDNSGVGTNYLFQRTMTAGETFTYWSGVVSGGSGTYSVTVTAVLPTTLTLNTPAEVTIATGFRQEVRFTAATAGLYRFESSNNAVFDPAAFTASIGGSFIDDNSGTGANYLFQRNMAAGEAYTYWTGISSGGSGSYSITVIQVLPINLTLNVPATIQIVQGLRQEVRFTAATSGTYVFESSNSGSLDPTAYFSLGGVLNDDGAGNLNFRFQQTMAAGETFIFMAGIANDNMGVTGTYSVTVTAQ